MTKANRTALAIAVALAATSCNRVPSYVIAPDDMAELMADVRMADAVVTVQRKEYTTEARKLALKRAVLARHGVSEEKFDTSLIWYGKNIGIYQDVTKASIEILEKRLKEAQALAAGEAAMSVSGDSVDIWDAARYVVVGQRTPTHYYTFNYDADPNWERGDVYTMRARLLNQAQSAEWNMTAVYDDGAVETITQTIQLNNLAKQEITLVTDSTRTATNISGWLNVEPLPGHVAIADSISLMRRRTSPALAKTRKFAQKLIVPKKNEEADTIGNTELPDDERTTTKQPAAAESKEREVYGPFRKVKQ